jgi:hypothetical protein
MGSAQCFFFPGENLALLGQRRREILRNFYFSCARNSTNFSNFFVLKFCQKFYMK